MSLPSDIAGASVLQLEEETGLALMRALTPDQQKVPTIQTAKAVNNAVTQAFRENHMLDSTKCWTWW